MAVELNWAWGHEGLSSLVLTDAWLVAAMPALLRCGLEVPPAEAMVPNLTCLAGDELLVIGEAFAQEIAKTDVGRAGAHLKVPTWEQFTEYLMLGSLHGGIVVAGLEP